MDTNEYELRDQEMKLVSKASSYVSGTPTCITLLPYANQFLVGVDHWYAEHKYFLTRFRVTGDSINSMEEIPTPQNTETCIVLTDGTLVTAHNNSRPLLGQPVSNSRLNFWNMSPTETKLASFVECSYKIHYVTEIPGTPFLVTMCTGPIHRTVPNKALLWTLSGADHHYHMISDIDLTSPICQDSSPMITWDGNLVTSSGRLVSFPEVLNYRVTLNSYLVNIAHMPRGVGELTLAYCGLFSLNFVIEFPEIREYLLETVTNPNITKFPRAVGNLVLDYCFFNPQLQTAVPMDTSDDEFELSGSEMESKEEKRGVKRKFDAI